MKCPICETKEFSVVCEPNIPIKDEPIIICYDCMEKLILNATDKAKLTLAQCERIGKYIIDKKNIT